MTRFCQGGSGDDHGCVKAHIDNLDLVWLLARGAASGLRNLSYGGTAEATEGMSR